MIEQKGLTLVILIPFLFSSLLKKEGREKENEVAKIVIKSHAFLLDLTKLSKAPNLCNETATIMMKQEQHLQTINKHNNNVIEQKGMTFDFCYS
jgi:hypothetical protein